MESLVITQPNGLVSKGLKWEIKKPVGKVVIMEGMEEHTRRYDRFAKFLNDNGFSVYALDAYGQGDNCKTDSRLLQDTARPEGLALWLLFARRTA